MKKKLAILIASVMIVSSALTGCGGGSGGTSPTVSTSPAPGSEQPTTPASEAPATVANVEEKVIIVRNSGYPVSFTPNYTGDDYGYTMHQNIYNRLCKLDAGKAEPIPDLASSWEYSDDVKTLTFHLKENAKWHDGVAVTSADVKYTFDTIKANPTYYFSPQMGIVDSIDTPDDYTVVFNLNTPDASFASLLGWYATFVLPQHIYDIGVEWPDNPVGTSNPVGSGPFKYESHKDSESVTLVKNEEYHDGAPQLDKLIFSVVTDPATAYQALKNGEIDYMTGIPAANAAEMKANPNFVVTFNDFPSPIRIIFNLKDEIIGDVNVRKAIATAINRDEISQKVYFGYNKPEYNYYPSFIEWATNSEDTAPTHDAAAAAKILENAGYTKNSDGYYISVSIDYFESLSGGKDTVTLMQAQLKEAGIELKLISSEYQAWNQKMQAKDFQIELQGGFMGPDPSALKNRLSTGMSSNYGSYSNPEFDELILKGATTADKAERAAHYKAAQKLLSEDIPYLPIVAVSTPESYASVFVNLPIDGTGKWGWGEFTYTDLNQ